jgi:lipopolysaccharide export system permease protein
MRNMKELRVDMDSIAGEIKGQQVAIYASSPQVLEYHHLEDSIQWPEEVKRLKKMRDSISIAKNEANQSATPLIDTITLKSKPLVIDSRVVQVSDSLFKRPFERNEITRALSQARSVKSQLLNNNAMIKSYHTEYLSFEVQWHKIMAQAIACIAMFLIGAPLGSIIKKGGLGVPVLMSILFFIVFYVLTLMGEKWAKQGVVSVPLGMWLANLILFSIGLIFLRQARADARLFDSDFYSVVWDKFKKKFAREAKK